MTKIGFVILHYYTAEDTIKCIESILQNEMLTPYEIVVVDNASPNGSVENIKAEYSDIYQVHVLENKNNLGFSAGNNVGFKYAKYELKCDYIILLNNDTELITKQFGEKCISTFETLHYGVMGPKIRMLDNCLCGFADPTIVLDNSFVTGRKKRVIFQYFVGKTHTGFLLSFYRKMRNKNESEELTSLYNLDKKWVNVVLHGCALIFSPIYVEQFDGLDELTFMYAEEELLFLKAERSNMSMLYNSDIEILHKEASSTKESGVNKSFMSVKYHICAQNALLNQLNSEKAITIKKPQCIE